MVIPYYSLSKRYNNTFDSPHVLLPPRLCDQYRMCLGRDSEDYRSTTRRSIDQPGLAVTSGQKRDQSESKEVTLIPRKTLGKRIVEQTQYTLVISIRIKQSKIGNE